jgi:endoglucanase
MVHVLATALASLLGTTPSPVPVHAAQAGLEPGNPVSVILGRGSDGRLPTGAWSLRDSAGGKTRIQGVLPWGSWWNALQDSAVRLDLGDLPAGTWELRWGKVVVGRLRTRPGEDLDLFRKAMGAFYHARASASTEPAFAGRWARAAGHPDTLVHRHPSTGQTGAFASPKGWYDAGDYGKYVVNSGITCWLLLDLAERRPDLFDTLSWPLPAGSDPALLRELRWNLDWMLTMQDVDGGVYHKLTSLRFDPFERPDQDTMGRWALMKTTTATLDFAAVFAKASRVWASRDTAWSRTALDASVRAWDWACAHPSVPYRQPADVRTGKYEDENPGDERFLAATEIALSRGDRDLWAAFRFGLDSAWREASWQDVGALALYEVLARPDFFGSDTFPARRSLLERASVLMRRADSSAYGISMDSADYVWGSNAVLAMQGIHLLRAFETTGDSGYLAAARRDLAYLLGANPFDTCFVTGMGTHPARRPHHRPSASDTVDDPVPGFLVGGPHQGGQDVGPHPWQVKDYRQPGRPALSWTDETRSYATNEVAINWNAALVHLTGSFLAVEIPRRGTISGRR